MSGRKRILLIDDDVRVSEMIRESLERLGYKPTMAASTEAARVEFLKNPRQFDLIMVENFLSDAVDPEFVPDLSHIRPDMRIVLYSGTPERVGNVRSQGIRAVIPEGLSREEFAKALERVFEEA